MNTFWVPKAPIKHMNDSAKALFGDNQFNAKSIWRLQLIILVQIVIEELLHLKTYLFGSFSYH